MAPRKKKVKVKGPPKKRGRPAAKRIGSGKAMYPMGAGKMSGSGPHYLHKDRYIEVPVDRIVEKVVREQPRPSITQRIKSVADIIQTVGHTAKVTGETIETVRKTSAYVQDLVGIKPSSFMRMLETEPVRAQPAPTARNFEGYQYTFLDRGTVGYQPSGRQEERASDETRQTRRSREAFRARSQARHAEQEARREIRDINVEMPAPPVEARNFESAEFTGIPQVAPTAAFTMGATGAVGGRRRNRAPAQQAQREAVPMDVEEPNYSFSYPGAREFTFRPSPAPMDVDEAEVQVVPTFQFRPSTPRFYRENVANLPYISNMGGWEMPPEGKKRRAANISQIGVPNPHAREKRRPKKMRI